MGQNAHTAGPWHPGHFGSDSSCQCRTVVSEVYFGGICTVHVSNLRRISDGGNDSPPEAEAIANMHLIAAAPEMFEALAKLLEQWEAFEAGYGNQEEAYYKLAKYARPHWEAARAAIAKAQPASEGE